MTAPLPPPNAPKMPSSAPFSGKKRLPPPQDETTSKILTVRLTKLTRSPENPSKIIRQTSSLTIKRHPDKRYFLVKDGFKVKLVSTPEINRQDSSDSILAPASPDKISSDDDGSHIPETPPEFQGRTQL